MIKPQFTIDRILKIIPGLLLWLVLLSPVYLSYYVPNIYGYAVILFASYWLYRAIVFTYGLAVGYYRYSNAIKQNWLEKCLSISSNLPKQLIVIPIGAAKYKTLKFTLDAIANQNYPKELIYISLSLEERLIKQNGKYYSKLKHRLKKEYPQFENRLMMFDHPANLEGEVIGAAANRSWGNKKAAEQLEKNGNNLSEFITTSPDEDVCLHTEYLGAMTYQYLINPKRLQRFYQTAVYLFANNYWEVPSIIRTWSMCLTLPVLASSVTHRTWRETWSCYSINLDVLKKVGYWDTSIGIDDTPFYWRPFDHFNGEFECEIFYVPLYADAVYHPSKYQNYIAQYRQLIRWGWGVVAFPIALKVFLQNKNIPLRLKLKKLAIMIELFVVMKVATIIFTFSIPLLNLFKGDIDIYFFSYTLSAIMQIISIFMLPMLYFKFKLMPALPNSSKLFQTLNFIIEIPLHFVILYTFAFFPFLIGPTLMMFGKENTYKVIEKY